MKTADQLILLPDMFYVVFSAAVVSAEFVSDDPDRLTFRGSSLCCGDNLFVSTQDHLPDYECTREKGHNGPHVAHGYATEVLAIWGPLGEPMMTIRDLRT